MLDFFFLIYFIFYFIILLDLIELKIIDIQKINKQPGLKGLS